MQDKSPCGILPYGDSREAIPAPHFPAHFQAVLWRNWGMVPRERIARVLGIDTPELERQAELLGLEADDSMAETWLVHGYQTIIRQNWHLLDYPDMLTLLGWDAERLAFILREDDFLWIKMGLQKPSVPSPAYRPLTEEELKATARLREWLAESKAALPPRQELPFAFKESSCAEVPTPNNSQPGLRLAYSYSALYGDPLMDPALDPFPDADLDRYAAAGINALWMHAVLYSLVPWLGEDSQLSAGWQVRQENLRRLCRRLASRNIKLLLYLNEPRALPDTFFDGHASWRGAYIKDLDVRCFCCGNPEVLQNLRQAVRRLFTDVPELGGIFCITHNENITNCWSYYTPPVTFTDCPVCREKGIVQTITSVVEAISGGVHDTKPEAPVLVWNWDWRPPWDTEIIRHLPEDIILMCTSENRLLTTVGGIQGGIEDYSISKPGPGPTALRCWTAAKERGLPIAAKVQVNNSWEMSAVPYLPVPGLVEEHLTNLRNLGINDFMVSWSLGGYPGGNLVLLTRSKEEVTREDFGGAADTILGAYSCFEEGFRHFPFYYNTMLYRGPHNLGPANLFHEKPTGYTATMVGFAYDDLDSWRAAYPEEVLEHEYNVLCSYWRTGLKMLDAAEALLAPECREKFAEVRTVAEGAYCHFRCTYLHIRFVRLRNRDDWGDAMSAVLREEMEVVQRLMALLRKDSRVGFEASNHYYYSEQTLLEHLLNCRWLLEKITDMENKNA